MNRRFAATAMVVAASIFTTGVSFAAPVAAKTPVYASSGKARMVSFSLHNATSSPIKVKAGDAEIILQPGSVTAMKLPTGTKVVAEESTDKYKAGDVLAEAIPDLSSATVTLN